MSVTQTMANTARAAPSASRRSRLRHEADQPTIHPVTDDTVLVGGEVVIADGHSTRIDEKDLNSALRTP